MTRLSRSISRKSEMNPSQAGLGGQPIVAHAGDGQFSQRLPCPHVQVVISRLGGKAFQLIGGSIFRHHQQFAMLIDNPFDSSGIDCFGEPVVTRYRRVFGRTTVRPSSSSSEGTPPVRRDILSFILIVNPSFRGSAFKQVGHIGDEGRREFAHLDLP